MALRDIRIVLVEPAGARNLGSVARVMKNFGLSQLVVVNPKCDVLSQDARQMAVHAGDLLESAIIVPDLPSALVGCHRIAATVGREEMRVESLRSALPWILPIDGKEYLEVFQYQTAIVFGREDHGLSNAELKYAQRCITIPSSPAYPSLNLAQAVGICCYELSQQALQQTLLEPINQSESGDQLDHQLDQLLQPIGQSDDIGLKVTESEITQSEVITPDIAPFQMTNAFYLGLEELLLTIGYLHGHTVESRMHKFRLLLDRAVPSHHEITMLLGILRQAKWAIGQLDKNSIPFDPKIEDKN